ncbi:hypothetical protein HMPREF0742_02686 [Rothia aeria F0184]|uniref:Uncharacterized protein n=1 Tax=Rothia aeria F0184 TaxID=888019 RepID=U7UWA6_9MICC|nr:hypothetical protein HMPREF0742_02686 [Rothia aeria F0184]
MKVPNRLSGVAPIIISLSRLQNEGSQLHNGLSMMEHKSIKVTE